MIEKGDIQPDSILDGFKAPELMNLLADGTYITDTERRIIFWNAAAERITGWKAGEVIGRCCGDNILVHVDKDGHQLCGHEHCPLHRSIVTGNASAEPVLVFAQHRSGFRLPVEVMVSPIRNHKGDVVGGIEVFRDLTETVQDQLRAREIQQIAVQCDLPKDERVSFQVSYEPRDIVGGDFYRIEKLDEDHYAILVADAKGHGVAAALYTLLLRSLWEEHRRDLTSPAQFMGTLNKRLEAVVQGAGYFGTAVLSCYDAATGEVRIVRAGHPRPILFRREREAQPLGSTNPALAIFHDTVYVETVDHLKPGDSLLFYTDGATELFDAGERELGEAGLARVASDLLRDGTNFRLEELEEKLLRFTNQIHLPDDLTLIKLSRVL